MSDSGEAYNKQARGYDSSIEQLVPDYQAFNALIPRVIENPMTVLDIGCGTGNTANSVLQAHPGARVTCVDPSSAMIEIARAKLGSQVTFIESAIETFQTDVKFDAVTSVMVMHNVQTKAERKAVYGKIHSALNEGGIYASVDIVKGECERSQALVLRLWRDFMLKSMPENEVDDKWLALHTEKDSPIKLSDQDAMLNEVGFRCVDIIQKRMNFALTVALK